MTINKKYVVIVAGGSGKRMETKVPKQFLEINGSPILMLTISAFHLYDQQINIILVLPENHIPSWKKLCIRHKFSIDHNTVQGGETRFQSVKNGLNTIKEKGLIAIHDGVRPFVKKEVIKNCFELAKKYGNAAAYVDPVDSIRLVKENKNEPIDRSSIKLMQTPQVFDSNLIKKAYEQKYCSEFTDDVSVVEKLGININLVEGNKENIKITSPSDIFIAEAILNRI